MVRRCGAPARKAARSPGQEARLLPLMGGAPHNFLGERAAEVAWSPDGTRLVYHTWEAGDPPSWRITTAPMNARS